MKYTKIRFVQLLAQGHKPIDKTHLSITLYDTSISYNVSSHSTVYFWNEKETQDKMTKKHIYSKCEVPFVGCDDSISPFAHECMYSCAIRMSKTALRTIYRNSALPYIYQLMMEVNRISGNKGMEDYLSSNDGKIIDYYLSETLLERAKQDDDEGRSARHKKAQEELFAYEQISSVMKLHTYTMEKEVCTITDEKGKKKKVVKSHRKEIIPYYTQEFTQFGKTTLFDGNTCGANIISGEDVVNTAYEAIMMLYRAGLLECCMDVWKYAYFVYRYVNNYIYSQAKRVINNQTSLYVINSSDEGEEEEIIPISVIDKKLDKINVKTVLERVKSSLLTNPVMLDKRCNVDLHQDVFELYYRYQMTQVEIAKCLKVSQKVISFALVRINKAISLYHPDLKEALYDVIYG